jgi:hypothetical protein
MSTKERLSKQKQPLRWQVYDKAFPTQRENVTLIFMGLAGFWCADDKEKTMGVGFHCKNDHHRLRIEVFDKNCTPTFSYEVEKGEKIDLKIEVRQPDHGALGKPGAYCFHGNGGADFNRDNKTDDVRDFRWLVDFEREFYPLGVRKHSGVYWPKLSVPSGLFYTLARTKSTFKRVAKNEPPISFGSVAKAMAANIYTKADGFVTLKWESQELTLSQGTGPGYAYFSNDCLVSGEACQWVPDSDDEKERSDFHLNYKAFYLDGKKKYGLKIDVDGGPVSEKLGPCKTAAEGTDRGPCVGGGFGLTDEFP